VEDLLTWRKETFELQRRKFKASLNLLTKRTTQIWKKTILLADNKQNENMQDLDTNNYQNKNLDDNRTHITKSKLTESNVNLN